MNPRYIRVVNLKRRADGRQYQVLQLAQGNEIAALPIYHTVRGAGTAKRLFSGDAAVLEIERLLLRDETQTAIVHGHVKQAK